MKIRKILSLALAFILTFSACFVLAYANNYSTEIKENEVNHYELAANDVLTCTFKGKGKYGIISFGDANPLITIADKSGNSRELSYDANGNILDTYDFGSTFGLFAAEYTINISAKDKKACNFDLFFFNVDKTTCGFVSQPSSDKVYVEDIDFEASKLNDLSKTNFDFTGAKFVFRNSDGTLIYEINDNNVKQILNTKLYTYSGNQVTYYSIYASNDIFKSFFNKNKDTVDYVTFKTQPNPIKEVRIAYAPEDAFKYTFGPDDGKISGSIFKITFTPDVKFDGVKYKVTFKDYVLAIKPDIQTEYEVQKDNNGYFIDLELYGKQYIKCDAPAVENNNQEVAATVTIGGYKYQQTLSIEKAGFFDMIKIWFGVLFGKYK